MARQHITNVSSSYVLTHEIYLARCLPPPVENTLFLLPAKTEELKEFPTVFDNLHQNKAAASWSGLVRWGVVTNLGGVPLPTVTSQKGIFRIVHFSPRFPKQMWAVTVRIHWRTRYCWKTLVTRNAHFVVHKYQWKTIFQHRWNPGSSPKSKADPAESDQVSAQTLALGLWNLATCQETFLFNIVGCEVMRAVWNTKEKKQKNNNDLHRQ